MAFGIDQTNLESALSEIAQMAPGDLEDLLAEEEEKADEIPDGHLINYLEECVRESFDASKDRREKDKILWDAHETEMAEMNEKEDWQSKIVLNKPFSTVIQAKSLVRRGLMDRPEYFEMSAFDKENPTFRMKADFWDKALRYWAATKDSFVPHVLADASEMGFSVGQSMAIKILWQPDENEVYRLRLVPFGPEKSYPDPDRTPRMPWSGLYNIHEEWIDFHVLRQGELLGNYKNIDQVKIGKTQRDGAGYSIEDREEEKRRKGQTMVRNKFRKATLTREFWGTILDENGEIVAHSASFTVSNGVVIRRKMKPTFRRLRWPWVDFSPIPHILTFHGYGLYEGVLALWKFQNALLNLYIDNENWRINNMYEIDPSKLQDPTDDEVFPGKRWIRKIGASAGPAITPLLKAASNIADVDFLWGVITNLWENGSFVTELMKGEQGERKDITATEIQLKLQQSVGVFDSIGKDVERGGTDLLWAMKEVLTTFWDDLDRPSIRDIFGADPVYQQMLLAGFLSPEERINAMDLDCEVKVEGVSRLFEREMMIEKLRQMTMLGENPNYAPYVKHYNVVKRHADELNQSDLVKSEQEVMVDMQNRAIQERRNKLRGAVDAALAAAGTGAPKAPAGPEQMIP